MRRLCLALLLVGLSAGIARAELVEGDAAVTRSRIALRERPGADYRVVTRVEAGEPVTVERVKGEWVRIKVGNHNGWAPASLLKAAKSSRARSLDGDNPPRKRKNAFVTDGQFARRSSADADVDAEAVEDNPPAPPPRRAKKTHKRVVRVARAARVEDEATDDDVSEADDSPPPARMGKQRAAKWKQTQAKASPRDRREDEDTADRPVRASTSPGPSPSVAASARPSESEDEDTDRTERAERRKSGERKVAAVRKTPLLLSPKTGASAVIMAREGDQMKVLKKARDGHWLLVEVDGTQGWIESTRVKAIESDAEDEDEVVVGRPGLSYLLRASTGIVSLSETLSSDATAQTSNYRYTSAAGAIAIGGMLTYSSGVWELGADGTYRFTAATPGVSVQLMGQQQDLALMVHTLDLGARAGYRAPDGMRMGVYGRLGYHMNGIQIDQTPVPIDQNNKKPLPNETISGLTIGGGLDLPRLSEHMGARARADLLVGAGRDETIGLRDGAEDGTAGLLLGLLLDYRFGEAWAAEGGYQLQYLSTNFKGPSERLGGQGSWANRTNTDHIILIGISYSR